MESVITLLRQGGICLEAIDPLNTSLNWTVVVLGQVLINTFYGLQLIYNPKPFTNWCANIFKINKSVMRKLKIIKNIALKTFIGPTYILSINIFQPLEIKHQIATNVFHK